MSHWRNLTPEDKAEMDTTAYCQICGTKRQIEASANLELALGPNNTCSHCNVAYKLECGHALTDDCDKDELNGATYLNDLAMRKATISKPLSDYEEYMYD